jgi:ribonuclease T2
MRPVFVTRFLPRLLVAASFAALAAACSGGATPQPVVSGDSRPSGSFVLALSWEPAFCETQPRVPECREQTEQSIDARQFSLHGLWPEDTYCGVDAKVRAADERHDWESLEPVTLTKATRAALDKAMPGTRSLLDRHEWVKHGTCSGVDQETYFAVSLALTDAVNRSSLPALFVANMRNSLSASRILEALGEDFGTAAATLECVADGSRRLISGLRIRIKGEIAESPDLAALMASAATPSGGCKGGVIDPAGLQ